MFTTSCLQKWGIFPGNILFGEVFMEGKKCNFITTEMNFFQETFWKVYDLLYDNISTQIYVQS